VDDLIDDDAGGGAPGNTPEFSVSEISGAVKRTIEGNFARVRVRGEIGRLSRPRSGHVYLDLKDDRSVLASVIWKGVAARLAHAPEEGMEVVATGRLTTFPGQSKYQLVIEDLVPAGAGALMAMLERRRAALAAEGLFDERRKQPLPFLPEVIGVVTSPSGAVIRDILHRLRDRFPRHVLIWPVAVQGAACAPEVARGIRGFNALPEGGPIPRPDVLIVARGGGSLEDLWGFNEEAVVRAAAESVIPLISAVGHETDTTLDRPCLGPARADAHGGRRDGGSRAPRPVELGAAAGRLYDARGAAGGGHAASAAGRSVARPATARDAAGGAAPEARQGGSAARARLAAGGAGAATAARSAVGAAGTGAGTRGGAAAAGAWARGRTAQARHPAEPRRGGA
jgi:hypothetical protein